MEQREESDTKESSLSKGLCLFKGFDLVYEVDSKDCKNRDVMKYKGGNLCALVSILGLNRRPYCIMENINDETSWTTCSLNIPRNKLELSKHLEKIKVDAKDFPRVSLKMWAKYVNEVGE